MHLHVVPRVLHTFHPRSPAPWTPSPPPLSDSKNIQRCERGRWFGWTAASAVENPTMKERRPHAGWIKPAASFFRLSALSLFTPSSLISPQRHHCLGSSSQLKLLSTARLRACVCVCARVLSHSLQLPLGVRASSVAGSCSNFAVWMARMVTVVVVVVMGGGWGRGCIQMLRGSRDQGSGGCMVPWHGGRALH